MLTWRSAANSLTFLRPRDLKLWVANVRFHLRSATDRSCRYSERQFVLLGAIAVLLIPATAVIEQAVAEPNFNTFYIRLLAGAAGLPILFHHHLPTALKNNKDLIWIGGLAFVFPFCYGAILTINAALTEPGSRLSQIWVYQYIVALFIFIQLTNSGVLSILLWGISTICVFSLCLFIHSPNYEVILDVWLLPLPVYLTALFIGSITNRNMHVVQAEQLRAASAIGSNIAHELRTPLASIRMLARGTSRYVPDLVEGYEAAKAAGLNVPSIPKPKLDQLRDALSMVQSEVDYSNTVIDMLLVNASESQISKGDFELFDISAAIQEAVKRFPFNNSDERNLVEYRTDPDFKVFAPRLFVIHVLFNIIKNGIYYVQNSGKGDLSIRTEIRADRHVVVITDTGSGIPRSVQHRIFERFYSTVRHGQGAGIGLSFCKMVMESIGGEIQCESREGEFTTFRLIFPPVDQMENAR